MTEDLNPYQPPLKPVRAAEQPERSSKRVTFVDWLLATVLGGLALTVTFMSTCIGVTFSFMASDFDMLAPIVLGFCFLFAIGVGCSASANYLASKARQIDGTESGMRSFRIEKSFRKPTKLDKFLSGCGVGLLALIVLIPSTGFLMDQLSETLHFSPDAAYTAQLAGLAGAVVLSLLFGWCNWRRVSSS